MLALPLHRWPRPHIKGLRGWAWQIHFVKPGYPGRCAAQASKKLVSEINAMPASLIDSAVFRDIFSTEAMRGVFSDENRVQKYLDFEAALARAQARLGIIPAGAGPANCRPCPPAEIAFSTLH